MMKTAVATALLSSLPAPAGAQCPLRALRENVRTQCGVDALLHCPVGSTSGAAAGDLPLSPPFLFLPAASGPPPVLRLSGGPGGPGTFDEMVEEMVGAAMAVFDEMARDVDGGIPAANDDEEADEDEADDMEEEEAGREHDVRLPEISSEMWGDSAAPPPPSDEAEGWDDTPDFRAVAGPEVPRPDGEQDEGEGLVFADNSEEDSGSSEDSGSEGSSEGSSEDADADWLPLSAGPLEAGDAALAALDDMVGSLFRSFLLDEPAPVAEEDGERVEHRKREVTESDAPDLFDALPRALSDLGSVLLSESRDRRRLSEGAADPRADVRERIGRRLTEYVRMTETYLTPGGGSITFRTTSALPDPAAASLRGPARPWWGSQMPGSGENDPTTRFVRRLGFATAEVDSCIYDRYLDLKLSRGCVDAVAGVVTMTEEIRNRHTARMMEARSAGPAAPAAGGGPCAVALASAGLVAALLVVALRCLGVANVLWSLAVAASVAAFGYWTLLVAVPASFLFDYLRGDDDEEDDDDEGADDEADFDYHECPGNEEGQQRGQGRRDLRPVPVPPVHGEPAVYVGVPIQVV